MTLRNRMLRAAAGAGAAPPVATDPQFNYVSLLLNDTGTNGQQNNTFLDSSSNNFTITRNGTPTQGSVTPYWPDGQWSNYFSGSGQYLSVPSNTAFDFGAGDFTVEAWVNFGSLGGANYAPVFSNAYLFYVGSAGQMLVFNGSSNVATGANGAVTTNTWTHLAWCRSGTSLRMFVNGVQTGSTATVSASIGSASPNLIGRYSTVDLNAYISNLRIVKGTAVYTSNFTPSTTPLTAVSGTSLLTCQSNRFKDNSSNNFAITVTGTPTVQAFDPFSPAASYGVSNGGSGYFGSSSLALNSADLTLTGDFTFEGWLFFDPATTGDFIFCIGNEASGRLLLGVNAGGTLVYDLFGLGTTSFGGTFPKGSWNYFTFVRSGSTMTAYINGVSTGTTRTLSGTRGNSSGAYVWGASSGSRTTTGYLSNMRLIRGTAVYTANFTPPTSPVTAITGTSLLLNCTNAGIYDAATLNDLVTVGNAQVSTAQAKFGSSSMAFDGTGDYLTVPNSVNLTFGTGAFTVEAWVNLNALGSDRSVIDFRSSVNSFGACYISGSGNRISFYDGSVTSSGTSMTSGTWNHLAWVRIGTTLYGYLNGVQQWTRTLSTNITTVGSPKVGADYNGSLSMMNGYIEDLRITKGYARYTANFTPPTAPFPTR